MSKIYSGKHPESKSYQFSLKVEPALDPLRSEPRFKELLKKMNLDK